MYFQKVTIDIFANMLNRVPKRVGNIFEPRIKDPINSI